jgi:hypothetical protein
VVGVGLSVKVLQEVGEVVGGEHEAREDGRKLKLKLVTPPVGIKNGRAEGLMKRLKGALSEGSSLFGKFVSPPLPSSHILRFSR